MTFNPKYGSGPLRKDPKTVLDMIDQFLSAFPEDLPIISVGSGRGYLEWFLSQKYPKRRFIGVDPETSDDQVWGINCS